MKEDEIREKFMRVLEDCRKKDGTVDLNQAYSSIGLWMRHFLSPADQKRMEYIVDWCDGVSKILDIGCGDGMLAKRLSEKGSEVVGVDISIDQLKEGKRNSKSLNFVRGDATHPVFRRGSFDVVVAGEVLEHLRRPFESLLEWRHLLKPNGRLILSTPNNVNLAKICRHLMGRKPPIRDLHLNFYDFYTIQQILNFAGYEIELARTIRLPFPYLRYRLFLIQLSLAGLFPAIGDPILLRCTVSGA